MKVIFLSFFGYVFLFVLCLGSFLAGWYLGKKRRLKKKTAVRKPKPEPVTTASPPKPVRAVQTRGRRGEFITTSDAVEPSYPRVPEVLYLETDENLFEKDNLRRIKGIGAVVEAKLNKIGVYTFLQVSQWTEANIGYIALQIEYAPERIKKERWVQQAASLLGKK